MLELHSVGFNEHHHQLIPPTAFAVPEGHLSLLQVPTRMGRTACTLIASGRLEPHTGEVLLDGEANLKRLRYAAAPVDSPTITEPEHHMKVKHVVAEALALHSRPPGTSFIRHMTRTVSPATWIRDNGFTDIVEEHVAALDPALRLHLLLSLAFADPQVRVAVVDSPDRHDISYQDMLRVLTRHTSAGRKTSNQSRRRSRSVLAVVAQLPAVEDLPAHMQTGDISTGGLHTGWAGAAPRTTTEAETGVRPGEQQVQQ